MTHAACGREIVAGTAANPEVETMAVLAPTLLGADYPFLDVMWSMFIFFAWVIFIYLLILVLADNFRRQDHSGWAKAGWTLFVIFVPLIGVLVYMIARPRDDLLEA
jgi:Phospholipase_D-nuclease N-terminal